MPNRYSTNNNTSAMANAALVFGIISLLSILFSGGSIFFGAMAIIFGLISRGTPEKPVKLSKYAIIIGTIALIISIVITVISVTILLNRIGGVEGLMQFYENILNSESAMDINNYMQDLLNQVGASQRL